VFPKDIVCLRNISTLHKGDYDDDNNNSNSKITEELSQPNENSDAKQDGIQHTKARLGESLKKMEKQSNAAYK